MSEDTSIPITTPVSEPSAEGVKFATELAREHLGAYHPFTETDRQALIHDASRAYDTHFAQLRAQLSETNRAHEAMRKELVASRTDGADLRAQLEAVTREREDAKEVADRLRPMAIANEITEREIADIGLITGCNHTEGLANCVRDHVDGIEQKLLAEQQAHEATKKELAEAARDWNDDEFGPPYEGLVAKWPMQKRARYYLRLAAERGQENRDTRDALTAAKAEAQALREALEKAPSPVVCAEWNKPYTEPQLIRNFAAVDRWWVVTRSEALDVRTPSSAPSKAEGASELHGRMIAAGELRIEENGEIVSVTGVIIQCARGAIKGHSGNLLFSDVAVRAAMSATKGGAS